jgi:hypothetical protein
VARAAFVGVLPVCRSGAAGRGCWNHIQYGYRDVYLLLLFAGLENYFVMGFYLCFDKWVSLVFIRNQKATDAYPPFCISAFYATSWSCDAKYQKRIGFR